MYFMNAAKSHVIPRFDESDTRKPLIQGLEEWPKVLDHHFQITVLLFYFICKIQIMSPFKVEHILWFVLRITKQSFTGYIWAQ